MWCDKPKPRLFSPLTMCDIKASIVHVTRNDRTHSGGGRERPHSLPLRQHQVTKKKRDNGHNTTEPSYGISIELFTRRKLGVGLICQHGVTSGKTFTPIRTSYISHSYFYLWYHFWSTFYWIMSFIPFFNLFFFSEFSLACDILSPDCRLCVPPATITAIDVVRRCGFYCVTK